jgi:signal transduction histidine kinase
MDARVSGPDGAGPRWIAWAVGLLVAAAAAGHWWLIGPVHRLPELAGPVRPDDLASPLVAVVLAGLGALVITRGVERRYGWLLLATGAVTGVVGFAGGYALYGGLAPAPGLPLVAVAGWVQDLWMVGWFLGFLLLPALFPDGTVASPRWRWPVRLATGGWLALIAVFMVTERPLTNAFLDVGDPPANPIGLLPIPEPVINVSWLAVTAASIGIGIGSLVTRWRGVRVETRQQLKWVLLGFGALLVVAAADLANQALVAAAEVDLGLTWPLAALAAATIVGLVVALGFAVLRFRLYDVDTVINRTIVYGGLTAMVAAGYVAIVVGAGALLPVEDLFLSLVATGIVAVAFTPLRTRLQRWVNRLIFGQRDDPYAVLSELGRVLARSGAPEPALQTLAETVASALKLPGAVIELEQGGEWQARAGYGRTVDAGADGLVVPMRHQGEVVGRLVVASRSPREPLSAPDRRLLEDIAHQAGAVAHAVRLTTALQRSREGLVMAREEERRRIRRDLHDGLGPTLASQTFRFDAVLARLRDDPAAAAEQLAALKQQNQQLVADVRRLVYELRPPAIDELGLAGALAAHVGQLDRTALPVVVVETVPDPLPGLPAAVEVAAYRITREAITNVVRHANATRCTTWLRINGSTLSIEVADDGVGLRAAPRPGVGLASMRERAEELGGVFEVGPAHPAGTLVRATLPVAGNGARYG